MALLEPSKSLVPSVPFMIEGVEYHLGVWESAASFEGLMLVTFSDTWRFVYVADASESKVVNGFGGYDEFFEYAVRGMNKVLDRLHPTEEVEVTEHLQELARRIAQIKLNDGRLEQ